MSKILLLAGAAAVLAAADAGAATVTIGGTALPSIGGVAQGVGSVEAGLTDTETFNDKTLKLIKESGWIGRGQHSVAGRRKQLEGNDSRFVSVKGSRKPVTFAFPLGPGETLDYIGLYWGSIDGYNFLSFLDADGNKVGISGAGFDFGEELSGGEFVSLSGDYIEADLADPARIPSMFANFYFDASERVTRFQIRQGNFATEIDNVSWRIASAPSLLAVTAVPAPGALALTLLGLGALVARRRR